VVGRGGGCWRELYGLDTGLFVSNSNTNVGSGIGTRQYIVYAQDMSATTPASYEQNCKTRDRSMETHFQDP
jgi:hypothetical protein